MPGVTIQVDHFIFANRQQVWVVSWKLDVILPVGGLGGCNSRPFDNEYEALQTAKTLSEFFEVPYTVCPTNYS